MPECRASQLYDGPDVKAILFRWLGAELFGLLLGPSGFKWFLLYFRFSVVLFGSLGISVMEHVVSVESLSLILHGTFHDLFALL